MNNITIYQAIKNTPHLESSSNWCEVIAVGDEVDKEDVDEDLESENEVNRDDGVSYEHA